ncbi:MAG: family N-acetyltransferase [Streptomyces oryziradicis]|nr:family N-acetyltransferase [Actinacidiphila oryziradicis]
MTPVQAARIRPGGEEDIPLILAMLDGAVEWLVAHGRSGQWGTEPWSARPAGVKRVGEIVCAGTPWIAEIDGVPAGTITLSGEAAPYVPAAEEPEVYVHLLVTDRRYAGRGVGSALLAHAREETRRLGIGLLRVDCYAGSEGRLVDYYRRNGFVPVQPFTVGAWPGQLLAQRVTE